LETASRINHLANKVLHRASAIQTALTRAENAYFTVFALVSGIVPVCLGATRAKADASVAALTEITSAVKTNLSALREMVLSVPKCAVDGEGSSSKRVFFAFGALHPLAQLRDAALLVLRTVDFALACAEKDRERDRSGAAAWPKQLVADVKALGVVSNAAVAMVKGHVKGLREELEESGWIDRLVEWTFGEDVEADGESGSTDSDEVVREILAGKDAQTDVEEWASKVLESWRETVRGLTMVKLE
jgi:hypothetical protein